MPKKLEKAEACTCENCSCGKCCCGKVLFTVLAILWFVAAILACFYSCKAARLAQKSYDLNVLSAWWQENIDKMNELYKSEAYIKYASDMTESNIASFNATYWNAGDSYEDTDEENNDWASEETSVSPTDSVLSQNDIAVMKANWVVYGPEDAKITIFEFADASCGYCKRQIWQDKTVDSVMEQYPNDVNVVFKNFPIFNETAAQAMACSEDYLSPENYHQYVVAVFQSDQDVYDVSVLANLAANYWADASIITNCVNNGEKANEVSATMNEGTAFGITWTPSSVIVNNESGEYSLVPGAYPASTFIETIESLLS